MYSIAGHGLEPRPCSRHVHCCNNHNTSLLGGTGNSHKCLFVPSPSFRLYSVPISRHSIFSLWSLVVCVFDDSCRYVYIHPSLLSFLGFSYIHLRKSDSIGLGFCSFLTRLNILELGWWGDETVVGWTVCFITKTHDLQNCDMEICVKLKVSEGRHPQWWCRLQKVGVAAPNLFPIMILWKRA